MSASRKCLKIIISRGKKRYQNLNFGFTSEESFSSCHLYFEVVQLLLAPRCANLSNSYMTQKKENKRIKRLTNNHKLQHEPAEQKCITGSYTDVPPINQMRKANEKQLELSRPLTYSIFYVTNKYFTCFFFLAISLQIKVVSSETVTQ